MKRVFTLLLLTTIMISCGSNKKTSDENKESTEQVKSGGDEVAATEASAKTMEINGKYTIFELNGSELNKEDIGDGMPTMIFEKDSMRYSTNIGCNQINGSYILEGDSIKFMPGMMTLMACPNSLEASYIVALEQVDNYKVEDFMLKVYQGELLKIVFQPMKK